MKYVKLFENWLNEAEGGVKPFDPGKPSETLVVDITNDNFAKANVEIQKRILNSIFTKCFVKNEKFENIETSIMDFILKSGSDSEIELNNDKGTIRAYAGYNQSFQGWDKLDKFDGKTCFLLFRADSEPIRGVYKDTLSPSTGDASFMKVLIFPLGNDDPKDFLLNSKWVVHYHDKKAIRDKKSFYETTLGSLAAWGTKQFKYTSVDILNDTNAGKPQNIAKVLGYEIPDNYTPGKGVEKTKA